MLTLLLTVFLASPTPADGAAQTITQLLKTHGLGAIDRSPALDRVAQALAAHHQSTPAAATAELKRLLALNGLADTQITPFTLEHQTDAELASRLPGLIARIEPRFTPTHLGAGNVTSNGRHTTTLLLVHRGVTLTEPLPQTSVPGGLVDLAGPLRRGYFRPRVLFAPPGSHPVRDIAAGTGDRRLKARLRFDQGRGIYGIEVVADSQYGPVVLLNHRVYVGVEPGATVPTGQPVSTGDPAQTLYRLMNRYRKEARRRTLIWHPILVRTALEHAHEMARSHSLRHASPTTGTLSTRLKRAGFSARIVAENLARADSPESALAAFIDSPGHKRNLLMPQVSYVGIAVVGRYYAVAMAGLE